MARGPGKGKTNNASGRTKGSPNKTTKEAKAILNSIIANQLDNIDAALEEVRADSPAKYLDLLSKFVGYVVPKKTDITTNDESILPKKPDLSKLTPEELDELEKIHEKIE
jgi:hypothetical protein